MVTGIYSLLGVLVYAILFLFVTVPIFFLIGCALYSLDIRLHIDHCFRFLSVLSIYRLLVVLKRFIEFNLTHD